ncbi:MAG TPA: hypothetical protein PLK78_10340 [Verrucomicrobiota bacterium]|nr:hypothetical protein [Verrucomicrobiota bacterium]
MRELRRRTLLPLAVLALAAYFVFVLAPLSRRSAALDAPLEKEWQALASRLGATNTATIDFQGITNRLAQNRQTLDALREARRLTAERLKLPEEVRMRMNFPFQLVDYENERSRQVEELRQLARQRKVNLDPAVLTAFPEHTTDVRRPSLLWPALEFIRILLTSAIESQVAAVHSLSVPPGFTDGPTAPGMPAEIPIQVEVSGSMDQVARLIQSLPLRHDELEAAGLASLPTNKPALFIDRLVIRKQSPDKLDDVRASLRIVGFVLPPQEVLP